MFNLFKNLMLGLLVTLLFLVLFIPTNSAFAQTKEEIFNPKTLDDCFIVSPDSLTFYANFCSDLYDPSQYDSLYFQISVCGDTGFFWNVNSESSWIIPSHTQGYDSAPIGVWIDWSLIPDLATLPESGDTVIIESIITVTAPGLNFEPQHVVVSVKLYCHPSNLLWAEPNSFEIKAKPGTVEEYSFIVHDSHGDSAITLSLENHSSWLTLPIFFTPPATPAYISFTVNTEGLASGIYYDEINIRGWESSNVLYGTTVVPVKLLVESSGSSHLIVTPEFFKFEEPVGSHITSSFHVTTNNDEQVFLNFYNHSNWLFLPIFFTAPPTPATIQFDISTDGLEPGTYRDYIVIFGWNESGTFFDSMLIPIELTVTSDSQYKVRAMPEILNISVQPGETINDSIHVFEVNNHNIPFKFENKLSWIWVYQPTPEPPYMTPTTLMIQATVPDIATGYYVDTIFINPISNSEYFPPIAVPVFITVQSDMVVIKTSPEKFDLFIAPGENIERIGLFVYEQNHNSVPFWVDIVNGKWLHLSTMITVIPFTPDSIFFEVHPRDLPPGTYCDTIVIYNPMDNLPWYNDVYVPVCLTIGDDNSFEIVTEPKELTFNLEWGEGGRDSLYVFEKLNREIPFTFHTNGSHFNWLTVEPFAMFPYYTPTSLLVLAFAADTLLPGTYVDTIFLTPITDFGIYRPTAVPVTMNIRDSRPIEGDSLVVASISVSPKDDECIMLPIKTRLSQAIKGATIPFEIPEGVKICSLSTDGLITENWDFNVFDVNNEQGYFFAVLANSFEEVIQTGETTVLNVFFKTERKCRDNHWIYWDTTFADDVSRNLAFTSLDYVTIHPGFDKLRNPTEVKGYTPGDYNNNGVFDIDDLVDIVAYAFNLIPNPPGPCILNASDVNGDCVGFDISDLIYMVDWVFNNGISEVKCGCVNNGTPQKNIVNVNYNISAEFSDGMTIISLNNPSEIRAVKLEITSNEDVNINNLFDGKLRLYQGKNNNITTIGLIDMDGTSSIQPGKNILLQLSGQIEIISASLSDNNYTTIYPYLGQSVSLPEKYQLSQNYPNPFNPSTEITFSIPHSSKVVIEIFNINGQKVITLTDDYYQTGSHSIRWESIDNNGQSVSSGIYLYKITADNWTESKKMMLLK